MHTLWIILACFSGVFAFAFLLNGILGFQEDELPKDRCKLILFSIDVTGLSMVGEAVRGIAKNWSMRPDERQLVYTGLICLIAFVLFVVLAEHTG